MSIVVGIMSLSEDEDMIRWLRKLNTEVKTSFKEITSEDTKNFQTPPDWANVRAVILLHSATKSGRLSLTDVKEARYDKLLESLHKIYGRLTIQFTSSSKYSSFSRCRKCYHEV